MIKSAKIRFRKFYFFTGMLVGAFFTACLFLGWHFGASLLSP